MEKKEELKASQKGPKGPRPWKLNLQV